MDGEISPPRFKLDKFLHTQKRKGETKNNPSIKHWANSSQGCWLLYHWRKEEIQGEKQKRRETKTHRAATERLTLSQKTPRHEQKSWLWSSSQSSNTLATLLNEALIDISARPIENSKVIQNKTRLATHTKS